MRPSLIAVALGVVAVAGYAVAVRAWARADAKANPLPSPGTPLKLYSAEAKGYVTLPAVAKTDEEWKAELTPLQYQVTRHAATERPFTGETWNEHRKGVYRCVACGNDLFRSDTKFESGTGWPSFFAPISRDNVLTRADRSMFVERTEVLCRRCGAHLGHVFEDGPEPTGLRYCMNSASLQFVPAGK